MTVDTLLLARRRASYRRDDGGAIMFVVAMTTAVLASVGVFALAAAATEVRTSGNERQSTQTHFLAEYGIVAVADYVSATRVPTYVGLMQSNADTCALSLPGVTSGMDSLVRACRVVEPAEMASAGAWPTAVGVVKLYTGAVPFLQSAGTPPAPGSFGPTPLTGGFYVEVTISKTVQAAGYGKGPGQNCCFVQLTATSSGVTRPMYGGAVSYSGEGLEVQRARFVAGPACGQPWCNQ